MENRTNAPPIFPRNERIYSLWEGLKQNKSKDAMPLFDMYHQKAMHELAGHALLKHINEIENASTPLEKGVLMANALAQNFHVHIHESELFASGTTVSRSYFDSIVQNDELAAAKNLYFPSRGNSHHIAVDYKKLISHGLLYIKEEVAGKLQTEQDPQKILFYNCMLKTIEAVLVFANRFKAEARRLFAMEASQKRKAELERIAAALSNVPQNPATTLFEGIQSIIIYHAFLQITERGNTSLGRIDYILHDLYTADISAGRITSQEASDFIAMLLVNSSLMTFYSDSITIAGQTECGKLFYNDLTYFCFDALYELKNENPQTGFRYMKGHPHSLFVRAMRPIFAGVTNPSIFGEETAVNALIKAGFEPPDARNYVNCQCVELSPQGKSNIISGAFYWDLSLPIKILMGLTGEKNVKEYDNFDELKAEYFQIMALKLGEICDTITEWQTNEHNIPIMFLVSSVLIDGTITKGKPCLLGGAKYNYTFPTFIAAATAVDSLAAIKQCVFEDKTATMAELAKACKNNFEGYEQLHSYLLSQCQKYGNNDPTTNHLMQEITTRVYAELTKYRNLYNEYIGPCYFGFLHHTEDCNTNIATPDGRKIGDAVSATFGSDMGRDVNGPTALLNSALSFDHTNATGGLAVNFTINKDLFTVEEEKEKLYALLKAYLEAGGMHVQFNFASKEELIAAKANPSQHFDLLVRVAGFTTRFVMLNESSQNNIISRVK